MRSRPSRANSIAAARRNMVDRGGPAGMIGPAGDIRSLRARDPESGSLAMKRPVVGVIGTAYRIEDRFATQMVGERNLRAVAEVAGALPLIFAGTPDLTDIGPL